VESTRSASGHPASQASESNGCLCRARARHLAYVGGWRKCEPIWDLIIRAKKVWNLAPVLERVLDGPRHTARAEGVRRAVEVG